MSAWRDISTAPKDGTELLIGRWVNGEWRVCQAAWTHFPGHDNHVQGYEPDVWWWNEDADWGGITDDEGPSHWQPLTPPDTDPCFNEREQSGFDPLHGRTVSDDDKTGHG